MVIPEVIRRELTVHSSAEAPNEACGLIAFRDGVAERYVPGINEEPSPYYFKLKLEDPELWFLEDEGYELGIFHSHLSSPARPSRTDIENIGLWEGKPYVILSLRSGELGAWRIAGRTIEPVELT